MQRRTFLQSIAIALAALLAAIIGVGTPRRAEAASFTDLTKSLKKKRKKRKKRKKKKKKKKPMQKVKPL